VKSALMMLLIMVDFESGMMCAEDAYLLNTGTASSCKTP